MKVLHVITNLGQGGAEGVLFRLVTASPPGIEHVVVSLMDEAYYGPLLRARGLRVLALNKPRGWITVRGILKLRRLITEARPDVVQTWMYHADLVGGLVARWAGVRAVVWGIRNFNLDADKSSFTARATARICASLSRFVPARIACCSVQAARVHQAMGYVHEKFTIISNGYDLSHFFPDAEARDKLRKDWGIGPHEILLGMVARWDPQKDHGNLLHALARLKVRGMDLRCVLVGRDMDRDNVALAHSIRRLGLEDMIILAGFREDIHVVMNALDLHVLSSFGEAFPNVLAEAMACGTPCVVTDVGDAALIVGDTGWVVPRQSVEALADGIEKAMTAVLVKGRGPMSQVCRKHISENFTIEKMTKAYQALWSVALTEAKKG